MCTRYARRASLPGQQRQQRLELDLGLGELAGGVGVAHDAVAGVAAGDVAAQQRAAQRDTEFAVAGAVRPADRPRVPAAVQALQRGDQGRRLLFAARLRPPAWGASARPARARPSARRAARGSAWRDAGCWRCARARARAPRSPRSRAGAACARCAGRRSRAPRDSWARAAAARRGARRQRGRRCAGWSRRARACSRGGPRDGSAARGWRRRASPRRDLRRTRSRRGTPRAARRTPPPGHSARGACTCTSRASTIFSRRPAAIISVARDDRLLVVLGRHRAGHLEAPGGRGVEQRQRRRSQLCHASREPREQLLGHVVGTRERRERQAHAYLSARARCA